MAYTRVDHGIKDAVSSISSGHVSIPTNISELLWEDKDRTLSELISTYRLPLAVKLKTGDITKYCLDNVPIYNGNSSVQFSESSNPISSNSSCDTNLVRTSISLDSTISSSRSCPESSNNTSSGQSGLTDVILQVHETIRRKIILARKMTWEKRQNDYVVSGEQIEIPASIKGWLEVVPDDGRPVEYFDTIGGIASIKPKRFLVRTSIVGYQLTSEENGTSSWMPNEIKSGEVLTAGIIYMDPKKTKNVAHRNILKRLLKQNKPKKEQDLKYLQCFNINGCEIMIPLIMSGVFSPVGDPSVVSYDSVYELQDLIIAFGLPVTTQFIHVSSKDGSKCPRGVIRLYGMRQEEMAIVSKVGTDGVLFNERSSYDKFEIPVDKMLFSRGIAKKKPIIKSKLVEGFPHSYNKLTNKVNSNSGDNEFKSKDYVYAKSLDDFRLQATDEKGLFTSPIEKSKTLSAIYMSKYAPAREEKGDIKSNTVGQQIVHGAQPVFTTTDCPEPNPQASLVNAISKTIDSHQSYSAEQNNKTDVELPKRVPKGLKKSRSTSILDKLSVRKVKKERAKLKELRSDDVFSKRISRSELSYQDFFTGLNNDDEEPKICDDPKLKQDDSGRDSSGGTSQSISSNNSSGVYSTSTPNTCSKSSAKTASDASKPQQRGSSVQNRDLPPIPPESQTPINTLSSDHSASVESLYEHLPPAPQPPYLRIASDSVLFDGKCHDNVVQNEEKDEDGYMVPLQVQQEPRYVKRSEVQLMQKKQGLSNNILRSARARRTRSLSSRECVPTADGCQQVDATGLFNFAYTNKYGENHPLMVVGPYAGSTSQLYGTIHASKSSHITGSTGNFTERLRDNFDLETGDSQYDSFHNSRLSKNLNCDPNATSCLHVPRKMFSSPKKMLNYTDSFHSLRGGSSLPTFNDLQNNDIHSIYDHQNTYIQHSRPQLLSSHSIEAAMMPQQLQQHPYHLSYYGRGYGLHHVESEPSFHQNKHPSSLGGISDALLKQGDDSAISLCSRGEAGCPYESNCSYKENMMHADDDWTPPEQLDCLSVQEVSKSLRYIGMKDRVVLRFSNEQIDGSMLCSLDRKLLKEGFPELNGLEIKKILDFVQGWRPKKS